MRLLSGVMEMDTQGIHFYPNVHVKYVKKKRNEREPLFDH